MAASSERATLELPAEMLRRKNLRAPRSLCKSCLERHYFLFAVFMGFLIGVL